MERKRIIIEADGGSDIDERLAGIEKKIADLKDKMSDKWVLPVLIVLITALMTAANFLITRHFANEDIYGNKLKEKIAELRATQTIDFFSKSIMNLDTLNDTFHSMCQFGPSPEDENQYNKTIIKIKALIDLQMTMDTAVVKKMKTYKEFVVQNELVIENRTLPEKQWNAVYVQSNSLYVSCIQQINNALTNLTER